MLSGSRMRRVNHDSTALFGTALITANYFLPPNVPNRTYRTKVCQPIAFEVSLLTLSCTDVRDVHF